MEKDYYLSKCSNENISTFCGHLMRGFVRRRRGRCEADMKGNRPLCERKDDKDEDSDKYLSSEKKKDEREKGRAGLNDCPLAPEPTLESQKNPQKSGKCPIQDHSFNWIN